MPSSVRFAEPILKAALKAPQGSVSALLTYPIRDVDGDYLNPAGGEWDELEAVNWEHGCPIGSGSVCMKSIPVKDAGRVAVPVGTTKFFSTASDLRNIDRSKFTINSNGTKGGKIGEWPIDTCLKAAEEAYELIEANAAPGVSVEFVPLQASKTGIISKLTNRSCLDVDLWRLQTWAHCAYPRNPGAMVLKDDTRIVKALSVAQSGRLPSGRPITSEIILKAFQGLQNMPRKRFVKAYDDMDPSTSDATTGDPMMADGGVEDPGAMDVPEENKTIAQSLYDVAQIWADACARLRDLSAESPNPDFVMNPKLAKLLAKIQETMCNEADAFVDDLTGFAEKAEAAVSGKAKGEEEKAVGEEESEEESEESTEADEDAEDDSELDEADDDDSFTKSLTPTQYTADGTIITKSGYKPRRLHSLKMSDLGPVEEVASDTPDPAQLKALQSDLDRLQTQIRRRERLMARNSY